MSQPAQKLRLSALIALVVGSMIGGGIFSLPQNMAARAEVGAVLIGWGITAVGMLTLAFVFQTLANRKPELDRHRGRACGWRGSGTRKRGSTCRWR